MGKHTIKKAQKSLLQSNFSIHPSLDRKYAVIGLIVLLLISLSAYAFEMKRFEEKNHLTSQEIALKKVIQPNVFFNSKIISNKNKTRISIPYSFADNGPQLIWLMMGTQDSESNMTLLLSQKQLHTLEWDRVSDGQLNLYQKQPTYDNIQDFINQPPLDKTIVADPILTTNPLYSGLNAESLDVEIDLESTDFIFTTYASPREEKGFYYYDAEVDATNARETDKGEIAWQILAPEATEENFFYLGDILVDYQ